MKYMRLLCKGLCVSAMLILCALLPHNAVASTSPSNVIRFGICGSNIRNILVTQGADTSTWHFEITLNSIGTKQFRHMWNGKRRSNLVELDWDGVSLGRVLFTSVINSANLSDAKYIHLQSRGWLNLRAAEAQMELLGHKDLEVPCGLID